MDPNFYNIALYEGERRKDELRQARRARLVRLARSDEAFNHHRSPGWLQFGFGRVLVSLGMLLYQLGSRITGSKSSEQPAGSMLDLTSSSSPGIS